MRKLLLLPAILFSLFFALQSCSKEIPVNMAAAIPDNAINATIAVNETYQLSVNDLGEVNISKQASHFQVSQTELNTKTNSLIYKYIPIAGYTGVDQVVLSTKKAFTTVNSGCSSNHNNSESVSYSTSKTIVTINITK